MRRFAIGLAHFLSVLLAGGFLRGEVVRLEITERAPFAPELEFGATGGYERVSGWISLEVDPLAAINARVVDLAYAPRNDRGRVAFKTEFTLLKPLDPSRGNRRLLYDVNNRGSKLALGAFQGVREPKPGVPAEVGNGFLFRQGYSILWCGWNGDVKPGDGRLTIELPVATQEGRPIHGRIQAEICVDQPEKSQPLAWGNSRPYPVLAEAIDEVRVTVRPDRAHPAEQIPSDAWSLARVEEGQVVADSASLYLRDGFRPGYLYEVIYESEGPRVTGLGFAAVRDVVSFFRGRSGVPKPKEFELDLGTEYAYAFGISQSARFIHHFLFEGFNQDESGQKVFDGAMPHVGGGGKGLFNQRFGQTTRHGSQHQDNLYPTESFPIAPADSVDPVTGEQGNLLARAKASGHVPKILFTTTSTEYWSRGASLLHTDISGERDLELEPETRLYFITGAQHGVSTSSDPGIYRYSLNTLDHRPVLRALLVALDRWVTTGELPPPSAYPRIDDGTLVGFETYRRSFPKIPGVTPPDAMYVPRRLDFGSRWKTEGIADIVPPAVGEPLGVKVPAIGRDGNEIAGVQLPDVAVPLATFAGWNVRGAAAGAEGALSRWSGSRWPLPTEGGDDSRPTSRELYPAAGDRLELVKRVVADLKDRRFLLDEDAAFLIEDASRHAP